MNILFSCAGRRAYLLKFFKESLGDKVKTVATDMSPYAPALAFADVQEIVPEVYATDYIEKVLALCKIHSIDAIISLNDLELPILIEHRASFENLGTRIIVSDRTAIDICFDKLKTHEFLLGLGIHSPQTVTSLAEAKRLIAEGKMNYPLIIKPRWGSGSIGIEIVDTERDLELTYELIERKVRQSILKNASIGDEIILIQEKIHGDEYGIDVINDLGGQYQTTIIKRKIAMRAGETDKAITVNDESIERIGRRISSALKHIGNLDCDVFITSEGDYFVLEMNPRFGGGYPFSHCAGANIPLALWHWLRNEEAPASCFNVSVGKCFAKYDLLVELPSSSL